MIQSKDQYNELVDKLKEASKAYYNGDEIMSNKEFDDLMDEVKEYENREGVVRVDSPSKTVGAEAVDFLPKFKHTYPALSLDKTKDVHELVKRFEDGILDSESDNDGVVLMWKEDGSTVQAYYLDGKLQNLATRGNGEVGSDITHNASVIEGIPLEIPEKGEVVVRGEALISYADFEKINEKLSEELQYKNPRNLAAASIQMLDPNEVKGRHVTVKAFNLVKYDHKYLTDRITGQNWYYSTKWLEENGGDARLSFAGRLKILKELGFNVVEHWFGPVCDLETSIKEMSNQVSNYPYPVDGLVVAMDNYEYSYTLEGTEHHPNIMQGYAFKWSDETAETVLREIEWSPSRTGLLNPVAIFDPVELEGTTVQRASLHNLSIMRKMRIHVGDKLSVLKSNKIIPFVYKNLDYDSEEDYNDEFVKQLIGCCPTCGSIAKVNSSSEGIETVYCPNEECPEKMIGKLAHFCSRDCMDIQGMSEETIKKLVDNGFIKEYADFFKLDQEPVIAYIPGFGKQSWRKMCEAAEKAKNTDFVKFITALSIPNIGKGQAKTLLKYINDNYDVLSPSTSPVYNPVGVLIYMAKSNFDFTKIDGFGDIMDKELRHWFFTHTYTDSPEMKVYMLLNFTDKRPEKGTELGEMAGKSFCITGKLIRFNNRQALVDLIEKHGGKWVDSVSKNTDYLINNDVTSTSGKNKKAKELNIPIISEDDFLKMIE